MATTNNSITHETPDIKMEVIFNPNRVSKQDATELHHRLAQLAPTTHQRHLPGAGAEPIPDVILQFILEHTASGALQTIGCLVTVAVLNRVKQGIQILLEWMQHTATREQQPPTTHEQQPTTMITLLDPRVINQTVTISTGALPPDLLAQVPDLLAHLPSHLHQPPLTRHTVHYLRIPVGYLGGIDTQYKDPTAPLRYWAVQGPTIPNSIAVLDTHTRTLIDPFTK